MKKVGVVPSQGSPGRVLPVFPDIESAYVWLNEARENPAVLDEIEGVDKVMLLPGDFIEAEWQGCEFVYETQRTLRFDKVRLARAQQPKNSSGLLVSLHYGWVLDCVLPFSEKDDGFISVKRLQPDESRLDLGVLFMDDEEPTTVESLLRPRSNGRAQ